jgi:hypothetical protein
MFRPSLGASPALPALTHLQLGTIENADVSGLTRLRRLAVTGHYYKKHSGVEGLSALTALGPLAQPSDLAPLTALTPAEGGHLDVMRWLRAQVPWCPWGGMTCFAAAQGGHLDVLRWLRAQDPPCPWGYGMCSAAGAGGHLDVLRWLRAQNPPCPWDEQTCFAAAQGEVVARARLPWFS